LVVTLARCSSHGNSSRTTPDLHRTLGATGDITVGKLRSKPSAPRAATALSASPSNSSGRTEYR
jgi:hypothetical protein